MARVRSLGARLRDADPGLSGLKSAARAAIVMPSVFAFAHQVIGDPQTSLFAASGRSRCSCSPTSAASAGYA